MSEFPVVEVRRNDSNGQKLLTVPKDCEIYEGHKVRLQDLGKHRDKIPDYLKFHQDIEYIMTLCFKETAIIEGELDEARGHVEDAIASLSKALESVEEDRAVYADVSVEEVQESCPHDGLVKKEEEEWRCKDCKKVLHLQGE